jgi:hypothetical protein
MPSFREWKAKPKTVGSACGRIGGYMQIVKMREYIITLAGIENENNKNLICERSR